jgi:hypothetical protein
VRVLPDQGPAPQFSGNQYFFNLWSCVHLFNFLQQSVESLFAMIQALAQLNPELFFRQRWRFRESGKLIQPAGTAKTLISEMCSKVSQLPLSGAAKCPDASSDQREGGILSVMGMFRQLLDASPHPTKSGLSTVGALVQSAGRVPAWPCRRRSRRLDHRSASKAPLWAYRYSCRYPASCSSPRRCPLGRR